MSLEKVTLENAADQLKSKIRMAFVELIPDEQWKEMVTTELKRFTQSTSRRDNYSSQLIEQPSDFSKICTDVFTEFVKTEVRAVLQDPEWRTVAWDAKGRPQISNAIKDWLTDNSKALIENTVHALAAQAAQRLVGMLR